MLVERKKVIWLYACGDGGKTVVAGSERNGWQCFRVRFCFCRRRCGLSRGFAFLSACDTATKIS